ncbi:hypothetical protein ACFVAJ_17085 [Agromyces sp. NPDC057679]|uniref:hypothetical protein n=1 Tax=Agromyces sp. NPDC057679 TaxID=3346207 RepID=UPI0036731DE0
MNAPTKPATGMFLIGRTYGGRGNRHDDDPAEPMLEIGFFATREDAEAGIAELDENRAEWQAEVARAEAWNAVAEEQKAEAEVVKAALAAAGLEPKHTSIQQRAKRMVPTYEEFLRDNPGVIEYVVVELPAAKLGSLAGSVR